MYKKKTNEKTEEKKLFRMFNIVSENYTVYSFFYYCYYTVCIIQQKKSLSKRCKSKCFVFFFYLINTLIQLNV